MRGIKRNCENPGFPFPFGRGKREAAGLQGTAPPFPTARGLKPCTRGPPSLVVLGSAQGCILAADPIRDLRQTANSRGPLATRLLQKRALQVDVDVGKGKEGSEGKGGSEGKLHGALVSAGRCLGTRQPGDVPACCHVARLCVMETLTQPRSSVLQTATG